MDDAQIIELLFQRSEQALGEMEERYGKTLHALAMQMLSSSRDAEECVNDAYLGAWNAIPPERPDCLLGYLCKIVRNLAIKRCRWNHAEKRGGYQIALEELEECLPDPSCVEAEVEAGELAGFSDNSHFIRTFGHLTGLTPGRYAKEYQSSDQILLKENLR